MSAKTLKDFKYPGDILQRAFFSQHLLSHRCASLMQASLKLSTPAPPRRGPVTPSPEKAGFSGRVHVSGSETISPSSRLRSHHRPAPPPQRLNPRFHRRGVTLRASSDQEPQAPPSRSHSLAETLSALETLVPDPPKAIVPHHLFSATPSPPAPSRPQPTGPVDDPNSTWAVGWRNQVQWGQFTALQGMITGT